MTPFPKGQKFLVSVSAMCTTDDFNCVSTWSAVIDAEDLHNIQLPVSAEAAFLPIRKMPPDEDQVPRPMTSEEIALYCEATRDENSVSIFGADFPYCGRQGGNCQCTSTEECMMPRKDNS